MSNQFFQFKQFIIRQDKCAMKVSTDACLFGAYTPVSKEVQRVLDIGTGTGLLAIMLAQRAPEVTIDALELDKEATEQAAENIVASPFASRINVIHCDINTYSPHVRYDLIISNPPFFRNSLLGDTDTRNKARHTLTLSYNQLINSIKRLLQPSGYASVLLPAIELEYWRNLTKEYNLHVQHILWIKPYREQPPNRIIVLIGTQPSLLSEKELVIYNEPGVYTASAIQLLSPYYHKEMR